MISPCCEMLLKDHTVCVSPKVFHTYCVILTHFVMFHLFTEQILTVSKFATIGKYYLCDAGYNTRPGFLAPYRSVRYHLSDYRDRLPTNYKELFNYRHSSLRTSVERAFGSLKGRFKILTSRPFFPYRTQVEIVIACCILHNFILSHGEDDFIQSEEEWTAQNLAEGEGPVDSFEKRPMLGFK